MICLISKINKPEQSTVHGLQFEFAYASVTISEP